MNILELRKIVLPLLLALMAVTMLPACETSEESEEQCVPYPDCAY